MRLRFKVEGNFEDTIKWLEKKPQELENIALDNIGKTGVEILRQNTPIGNTGETANSWTYTIEKKRGRQELSFKNHAHSGESVNVAVIKEFGHGTGTGGYVSPRPYIRRSMDQLFDSTIDITFKDVFK